MKRLALLLCTVSAAACATGGSKAVGPGQFIGGESGDLRVLINDTCQAATSIGVFEKGLGDRGLGGVAEQMLASIGGIAFQSFGTFLKHAGEPDITRSIGINGGQFYVQADAPGAVTISPRMRCIYLVRNGFASRRQDFDRGAPEDLRAEWLSLGLTRTPDLFAALHLETAGEVERRTGAGFLGDLTKSVEGRPDLEPGGFEGPLLSPGSASPPFFRARLDRVYLREFQNPQGVPDTRDLAIVLNYGLAWSQATIQSGGANAGVTELSGKFAVGGVRFAGVGKGDHGPDSLVALQTGWMAMPPVKPFDPRATVDLSVYVVEFSPGNRLLEEIGSYLASEQVGAAVEGALKE